MTKAEIESALAEARKETRIYYLIQTFNGIAIVFFLWALSTVFR